MRTVLILGLAIAFVATGLASASDTSLEGEWQIEAVKGVDSFDTSKTEAVVMDDGSIAITVGCNRMLGKPKIEDSMITFGPVAGTLMACPPPLDVLEESLGAALDATRSFKINGTGKSLTFLNEAGEAVVTMARRK